MRHVCPRCNSAKITLTGVEEGWQAEGPRGIHRTEKSYRCRNCGHSWTDHFHDKPDDQTKD